MAAQKVSSFMQTHIVGVSMTTKLGAALKLAERSAVNLLPILHGGRLVGVLTREEI
ncbi:MAG: CBS domain-containing protein, partial [Candidatus Micrarchaeota archaeon]|nr:CBS domain-containing protein [Candidatus Micrarchaeota archaeon]